MASENLFELLNQEGVVIVASSRSGAEEVYRANDGGLYHVRHLKSGRDTIDPIADINSAGLTVRYNPPRPAGALLREYVER